MIAAELLLVALLLPQAPAGAGSSIGGRFVSAQTGEPLPGVNVGIEGRLAGQRLERSARTAPDGTFSLEGLPAGTYSLSASKTGYRPAMSLPVSVTLAPGQNRADLEFRMHRSAVITGTVTGADGEPLAGLRVTAWRFVWSEGRRSVRHSIQASTDDRGAYRLFGLPPARYVVVVRGPAGEPPTYYPSASRPSEATPVAVQWGREASGVHIVVRPGPSFSIAGRLLDAATGGPCRSCSVEIKRLDDVEDSALSDSGVAPDGAYRLSGLAPGLYRVWVEKAVPPDRHQASCRDVLLSNRSLDGVDIAAGIERTLRGRVVLESPPAELPQMKLEVLAQETSGADWTPIRPDLTFEISGLAPLKYHLRWRGFPEGAYLKKLRLAGRDLAAPEIQMPEDGSLAGLEAVVAFDGASVAGAVAPPESAGRGHRVTAALLVLWPQEGQSPLLIERRIGTDPSGRFQLNGVAPGAYQLFALPLTATPEIEDPEIRRRYGSHAQPVELVAGRRSEVNLVLAPESAPEP